MVTLRFFQEKSQYFEAMFRSNMRESIEGIVVVPDNSAGVFLKMLEYVYFDDFVLDDSILDDLDDASRNELSVLADMYLLDGLKLFCDNKYECDSLSVLSEMA